MKKAIEQRNESLRAHTVDLSIEYGGYNSDDEISSAIDAEIAGVNKELLKLLGVDHE